MIERFWKKVEKTETCWLWKGSWKRPGLGWIGGYGIFSAKAAVINGKLTPIYRPYAHRFSWEIANGPIPKDLYVLHKCDNPPCVNPEHLYLGTAADNFKDMISRGRRVQVRGITSGRAKFAEQDIRDIRELSQTMSNRQLAKKYKVVPSTIHFIVNRVTWKHID